MKDPRFSATLRELRQKTGLSQEAFAHESNLHRTYISQLERGMKSPSLDTLDSICKALGIRPSAFLKRMGK